MDSGRTCRRGVCRPSTEVRDEADQAYNVGMTDDLDDCVIRVQQKVETVLEIVEESWYAN